MWTQFDLTQWSLLLTNNRWNYPQKATESPILGVRVRGRGLCDITIVPNYITKGCPGLCKAGCARREGRGGGFCPSKYSLPWTPRHRTFPSPTATLSPKATAATTVTTATTAQTAVRVAAVAKAVARAPVRARPATAAHLAITAGVQDPIHYQSMKSTPCTPTTAPCGPPPIPAATTPRTERTWK